MKKGYLEQKVRCAFESCVAEETFEGEVPVGWFRFTGENRYVCLRCARTAVRAAVDAAERTMVFMAKCSECGERASFDLLMRNENDLQGYTVRALLCDVEYQVPTGRALQSFGWIAKDDLVFCEGCK